MSQMNVTTFPHFMVKTSQTSLPPNFFVISSYLIRFLLKINTITAKAIRKKVPLFELGGFPPGIITQLHTKEGPETLFGCNECTKILTHLYSVEVKNCQNSEIQFTL